MRQNLREKKMGERQNKLKSFGDRNKIRKRDNEKHFKEKIS